MSRLEPDISDEKPAAVSAGPWSPLSFPLFRSLWIATVVSNIATWMHDVGAAWLMTSLAPSPLMVSMVQAAASLPLFVFALPAGALADVVDRRRLLLFTQGWMLCAAAVLAYLTFSGKTGPVLLVVFTLAIGIGTAFNAPPWQAIVQEIVPREELSSAVAINSAGINLARAIGPAVGGLIVAASGPHAAFGLNALSFVGVMFVLYRWKRAKTTSPLPAEHLFGAMIAGLRYVRHAPGFRYVLGRALLFVFPASALWALLPLLARQELQLGASGYGVLLGAIGAGALVGAYFLPKLRAKTSVDQLTTIATVAYGLVLLAVAVIRNVPLLMLVMFVSGALWIGMVSSLNVAAQSAAAGWVRARALSVYLIFFFGSMAVGSLSWGALASAMTMPTALGIAAVASVLGAAANRRLPLKSTEGIDLSPSFHWPEPGFQAPLQGGEGPAMVTVEYHIDTAHVEDFRRVMHQLRASRLRDGAIRWNLFNDPETPGRYLECFIVGSWLEHLRQHERVTESDREIQAKVQAFQCNGQAPVVSHYIAEKTKI